MVLTIEQTSFQLAQGIAFSLVFTFSRLMISHPQWKSQLTKFKNTDNFYLHSRNVMKINAWVVINKYTKIKWTFLGDLYT